MLAKPSNELSRSLISSLCKVCTSPKLAGSQPAEKLLASGVFLTGKQLALPLPLVAEGRKPPVNQWSKKCKSNEEMTLNQCNMDSEGTNNNRGGRPKKDVVRDKFAGAWFTQEEYKALKKKAVQANVTVSCFLQKSALHAAVAGRQTEEEKDWIRQLSGMARNLNQIAHRGHIEGYLSAAMEFKNYREKINELITKLKV